MRRDERDVYFFIWAGSVRFIETRDFILLRSDCFMSITSYCLYINTTTAAITLSLDFLVASRGRHRAHHAVIFCLIP